MEEAGGWSKGRKTFQKRQDLSQTRGVGSIGAVLVSQSIVSTPFSGAEIPLGNWVEARHTKPVCSVDTVRLLFYQQAADRNSRGKACHNEPVGNPRVRLCAKRCPSSIVTSSQHESGEQDTGDISRL